MGIFFFMCWPTKCSKTPRMLALFHPPIFFSLLFIRPFLTLTKRNLVGSTWEHFEQEFFKTETLVPLQQAAAMPMRTLVLKRVGIMPDFTWRSCSVIQKSRCHRAPSTSVEMTASLFRENKNKLINHNLEWFRRIRETVSPLPGAISENVLPR